jgi:8-oxo-dGTP pyrophosphatase MutT (NUDIX family)
MHRNLDRRVEVAVRITDPRLTSELDAMLDSTLDPATRCWVLGPDGEWQPSPEDGSSVRDHQARLLATHRTARAERRGDLRRGCGAVAFGGSAGDRGGAPAQIRRLEPAQGKARARENLWRAAAREVAEETGFSAVLGRHVGRVRYRVQPPVAADKTVDYLAARAVPARSDPTRGRRLRWVHAGRGGEPVELPHDARRSCGRSSRCRRTWPTVLLVRHAKAGSRSGWSAADEARPAQ